MIGEWEEGLRLGGGVGWRVVGGETGDRRSRAVAEIDNLGRALLGGWQK